MAASSCCFRHRPSVLIVFTACIHAIIIVVEYEAGVIAFSLSRTQRVGKECLFSLRTTTTVTTTSRSSSNNIHQYYDRPKNHQKFAWYLPSRRQGKYGDYYYDDDDAEEERDGGTRNVKDYYQEEDGVDDNDDDDYSNVDRKRVSRRRMEPTSKNGAMFQERYVAIQDEVDDDDVYEEEAEDSRPLSRRLGRNGRLYAEEEPEGWEEDEEDEYYYPEDDYDDDMAPNGGNFWSNPPGGMDPPPAGSLSRDLRRPQEVPIPQRPPRRRPRGSLTREYDGRPDYYVNDSRRTPRKGPAWRSPVRTSPTERNPFWERLYDKVFFYGIDMGDDDDDDVGLRNKSAFGGTKGKFNGLNYLAMAQNMDPYKRRPARGLPASRNGVSDREEQQEYYSENEEEGNYSRDDTYSSAARNRYNRRLERSQRVSSNSRRPRYDDGEDDFENTNRRGRRMEEQVSTWFTDEDNDDDSRFFDEDIDDRSDHDQRRHAGRRRDRQRNDNWTPREMLESFFGIDREEMAYKATEYDSKMGLRRARSRRQSRGEQLPEVSKKQRTGYAYRYDASQDTEDSPTIVDIDATIDMEEDSPELDLADVVSSVGGADSESVTNDKEEKKPKKKEKSWEERQAAVERVPPMDIPAWGPKGQLPINARQKAIEDALKDVQTAKRKLNDRTKKEIKARDEIAILNVDAKALRLKMKQSRRGRPSGDASMELLRQIELEIDDASRALRRARNLVDMARDEVEELEERHYAVLSYYNPDQASKLIGEALNEFSEQVNPAFYSSSTPADTSSGSSLDDAS